jgi:hypothetical protein
VEIPKTGSTSIRNVIDKPRENPHRTIVQIRAQMREQPKPQWGIERGLVKMGAWGRAAAGELQFCRYYKFGVVRNPWDRVVSLYLRKEGIQMQDQMDFESFVDWIQNSSDTCIHCQGIRYQADWLRDKNGMTLVDFIARFENLEEDWKIIARRLGLVETLPRNNANGEGKRHYTDYYTPRTREVIGNKFAEDIRLFNYRFGE